MIGSIIGGLIGQGGAQSGGDMAWGAAQQGNQQTQQQQQRNRALASPWTGSGESALGRITQLLGLGTLTQEGNNDGISWVKPYGSKEETNAAAANAFQLSPGYDWRKSEGIKALDRSAAARGTLLSGAQIKGVQGFGDGLASEEYQNQLGNLFSLAGLGGQATASVAGNNSGLASAGGNMLMNGGIARGSAYAQGANALASGIGNGINNVIGGAYLGKKAGWF